MGINVNSCFSVPQPTAFSTSCSPATVQLGETNVQQVARRLNVDPDDLLLANPQVKDPFKLTAGQTMYLPLDQPQQPSPTGQTSCSVAAPVAPPSDPKPAPPGDPLTAAVITANLSQKAGGSLSPDEQFYKSQFGDEVLKYYRDQKQSSVEVRTAHDIYEKTGQIPQTKHPFAWIEIKEGRVMTRGERYDAMIQKQGKPNPVTGDLVDDNRDPEYLTKEEFHDEFWAREKKEFSNCSDEYTRPGKIYKCQKEVDEKYGGEEFKAFEANRDAALRAAYQEYSQRVDAVVNSGPVSLTGRAIGQTIDGDRGGDIGGAFGGFFDAGLAIYAGVKGGARIDNYNGSAGLGAGQPSVEVRSESRPAPIEGAEEVRLSQAEYQAALGQVFPSQYLDQVTRTMDSVGRGAAQRATQNPQFVSAVQNGNWALAGTLYHSAAATEVRALPPGSLPPGWSITAEEVIQGGRGGSRTDVLLRGPGNQLVEFDWKTSGSSALSTKSRQEMTRHAGQITANVGGTLTAQQSRSWMDFVRPLLPRVAWPR